MTEKTLHTIDEIKSHFQASEAVTYFISATNFNLMAMDGWVKHWFNVNVIDCYDGRNRSVVLPHYSETPTFEDIESINRFLLGNKSVVEQIRSSRQRHNPVNAMFLFYDKEIEKLVDSLGMTLIMPDNDLVKHIDNKIVTTEIGNSVEVPSVPNALARVESYRQLRAIMAAANLGDEVVIQTPFGDSGKTTFFIDDEKSYQAVADKIASEERVKIMRRIECRQVAIEACATRQGTFVGPILTEIIGHPDLTPYQGGWCGNDINPARFERQTQETIVRYTERLGQALYEKGYRGYFEVDYLIDIDDAGTVYLGEINPRITGISALTNMSAFCRATIPLFLFHLLEFSQTAFDLDPALYNRQVLDFAHPPFGQLVFKYTRPKMAVVTQAPATGVYRLNGDKLAFVRHENHPATLADDELFLLRIIAADDYAYKGADLVILFARQPLQGGDNTLTTAARRFISAVNHAITYRPLTPEEQQSLARYHSPASIKSGAQSA